MYYWSMITRTVNRFECKKNKVTLVRSNYWSKRRNFELEAARGDYMRREAILSCERRLRIVILLEVGVGAATAVVAQVVAHDSYPLPNSTLTPVMLLDLR